MNPQYSRYYTRLQPIFKNKVVKTYSHIVFSLIVVVIFSVFAIRPTVRTILTLQKTIDEQQTILKQLKEKTSNIKAGIQAYDQINTDTKLKLYTLLPSSTSITCIINDFNFVSGANQATINGMQFQPTELIGNTKCQLSQDDLSFFKTNTSKETGLKEINFALNSTGDYSNLVSLLNAVNRASRLTNIESVTLTQPPEGNLIMIINGKSYFYK